MWSKYNIWLWLNWKRCSRLIPIKAASHAFHITWKVVSYEDKSAFTVTLQTVNMTLNWLDSFKHHMLAILVWYSCLQQNLKPSMCRTLEKTCFTIVHAEVLQRQRHQSKTVYCHDKANLNRKRNWKITIENGCFLCQNT